MPDDLWEPVLDGPLAARAWTVVREIADTLAMPPGGANPGELALFWAYAAAAIDDEVAAARYDRAVAGLLAAIEGGVAGTSLYDGLAGTGWVMAHIADDSVEDFLAQVDDALAAELEVDRWRGPYDLIDGIAGVGTYFVERLRAGRPAPAAARGLARVVDHLARLGEEADGDAVTWFTRPEHLPAWQRAESPDGHYNCGVAHGVPGVIATLACAATTDALDDDVRGRARALADRATRWLSTQRLPPDPRGRFPDRITPGRPVARARTAWCYGDAGIAAALWSAARRLGTASDDAESLARECATRDPAVCGVRDAALCHGAIGLAHLHNRFFQASRDPIFREAAREWFARGLAMRSPGHGVAGFSAVRGMPPELHAEPGFLEGAAGIGLALLAALQPSEPGWDRLLLCDVPPRAGGAA